MECQVKLRGIRMREGRLVITLSIGRDPGATPVFNTGPRMNWFGNTIISTWNALRLMTLCD